MIALVIVALITGLTGVAYLNVMVDSERSAAKLQLQNFEASLDCHFVKTGRYPPTEAGLEALRASGCLKKLRLDPWKQPYRYELVDGTPVITSLGRDGQPGGSGADADLKSTDER